MGSYTFSEIVYPGATYTYAQGVSLSGTVFGYYIDNYGSHSFIDASGNFSTFTYPNASATSIRGISSSGEIVGNFTDSGGEAHGFVYSSGISTAIDAPGASYTSVAGINATGHIVGTYIDSKGQHGFLDTNDTFTTLDAPESRYTSATAIDDAGHVFGTNFASPGGATTRQQAFVYANGSVTVEELHPPGGRPPSLGGVNEEGVVYGTYSDTTGRHGFLETGGSFSSIDIPGSSEITVTGVSADGQVVGYYRDGAFATHSFLATPVAPANGPPVSADDVANVAKGRTVSGKVLANDTDPDGDKLSVTTPGTVKGAHGTLMLKADGSYAYTSDGNALPASGYVNDTFTFDISDGHSHMVAEHLSVTTTANGTTKVFDGSAGGATLTGTNAADILVGGPDDILTGRIGADRFVFNAHAGRNTITDFDPKVDKLVLDHALIPSAKDILHGSAHVDQIGGDLILDAGHGDVLTLQHTTLAQVLLNAGHDVLIV
ncbi:Ig-like domain-containing protein [Methylobacterium soli]|uniref:RapA2 cadherin-like domain-containing protein n=1 Tax=Methylobacterium soli TaxID=553447 RepID=A0A6L3SRP2_9HYPH|nr:Ig-like domain-containing protein [Methylobacterium soli]KAB1075444.1 hypothetical protein F6X53_25105 [Methylobacterium soli]GJE43280.1 hypothetical protein AEGHOMDF_2459 [Methylobacterium soli]